MSFDSFQLHVASYKVQDHEETINVKPVGHLDSEPKPLKS